MRDRSLIYAGLFIFLALITFPMTGRLFFGSRSRGPDLTLPADEERCVAPAAYMKSSHMQLLLSWREERVRRNVRTYTAYDGRSYNISLSGTCLTQCHESKSDFCDRCHNYVGVPEPSCMDCHVDPARIRRSGP